MIVLMIDPLESRRGGVWNLDEFVGEANRLLPEYLPKEASARSTEPVNARLVRHYTTQGLVAEPRKEGREARYLYEHLIQLLVVRKLLAEGFTGAAIKQVLSGRSEPELEPLLAGTVRIELVPETSSPVADEREAFLRSIRERAGLPNRAGVPDRAYEASNHVLPKTRDAERHVGRSGPRMSAPLPGRVDDADSVFHETGWTRLAILDGLELHVREGFQLPTNRLGDEQLAQLLKTVLLHLEQTRKGSA